MNCSMPGLPVHQQLSEVTQTHVHQVGDAIQPSHPLSSPSPPAPNPSQHQSLFQWVNFAWGGQSTGVSASASVLPKNTQDWSPLEWTGWISWQSKGLSRVMSKVGANYIWWCPCVESSLVLLEKGVCYDQCILLTNSFSLCPASFCTPRPYSRYLLTSYFCIPVPCDEKDLFLVIVLEALVGLHRTSQLQLLWH